MQVPAAVTLCMTIGNRPDLLDQTLSRLRLNHQFDRAIAVNDFGDQASNEVFLKHFPQGTLICTGTRRGHHSVMDDMYARVETDYIFHIEDDWAFNNVIPFERIIEVLTEHPSITSICLRELSDFAVHGDARVEVTTIKDLELQDLTPIHPEWYGYTFNPHIISKKTVSLITPYTQFKKERHISRFLRSRGKHAAYLRNGGCVHIGDNQSVANRPEDVPLNIKFERMLKSWVRSLFKRKK